MDLNIEKCEIMQFGKDNPRNELLISSDNPTHKLSVTSFQRDLGILVSDEMKWSKQVNASSSRANRLLEQMLNDLP